MKKLLIFAMLAFALLPYAALVAQEEKTQEEEIKKLIEKLQANSQAEQMAVAEKLAGFGERAVPLLVEALKHDNRTVCVGARIALIRIGKPAVIPVARLLKDNDKEVRKIAMATLMQIADERAVEALIGALQDEEQRIRRQAIQKLGNLGDKRAVQPLIELLKDKDGEVRRQAAAALGKLGDEQAVEPLIAVTGDKEKMVRWVAARVLIDFGDKRALEPLKGLWKKDDDKEVQVAAAYGVVRMSESKEAFDFLLKELSDESEKVRQQVAEALGLIGDKKAVEPLMNALGDTSGKVREEAAKALGLIGDEKAVKPLETMLRTGKEHYWVAWALGKIGGAGVKALIVALEEKDDNLAISVVEGLRISGDERAIEPLMGVLGRKDGNAWKYALGALLWMGDKAVGPLIGALKNGDETLRGRAASLLKKIAGEDFGEDQEKWNEWHEKSKGDK